MEYLQQICNQLGYNQFDDNQTLNNLSVKYTGGLVKPSQIMLCLTGIVILMMLLNIGAYVLSGVIGFIYPAYLSFKALETESKDDDKLLLTYWTVYGFMTLFDPILVFAFSWIPMFQFIKLCFYLWMCGQKTQGALIVYDKVLLPVIGQFENQIDDKLNGITENLENICNQAKPIIDQFQKKDN